MYRLDAPASVDLFTPDCRIDDSYSWQVSLSTQLFRRVGLPQALGFAYDRSQPGKDLTVVSAACSTGAEADSVMALHNHSDFGGQLAVFGYDIHPTAIKQARQGVYFLPAPDPRLQPEIEREVAVLREHGFEVDSETPQMLPLKDFRLPLQQSDFTQEEKLCYLVDAGRVRQPHQVSFEGYDLSKGPLPVQGADLILANNVLYHLRPSEATRVVRYLAGGLAHSGVLSIGGLKNARFRMMGTPDNYTDVRYKAWLDETMVQLEAEFDLKVRTPDHPNEPAKVLTRV